MGGLWMFVAPVSIALGAVVAILGNHPPAILLLWLGGLSLLGALVTSIMEKTKVPLHVRAIVRGTFLELQFDDELTRLEFMELNSKMSGDSAG